jgi:hypothetical protein
MSATGQLASIGVNHAARRPRVARAAGVGYLLAWVAGLSVFNSSTEVRSSGADVLAAYAGHQTVVSVQYLLTEGLAGVLLAVVVGSLASVTTGVTRRVICVAGMSAAAVSLVQCALGIWLAERLVGRAEPTAVGTMSATLNRLDGVKMLLLAGFAAAVVTVARSVNGALPHWLVPVAGALMVTITVSAAGYVALNDQLAVAAWLSLPLLLAVVTAVGVTLPGPGPRLDGEDVS